jgi:hypothetical protein
MTIGKFPSHSISFAGKTTHYYRHPEDDMKALETMPPDKKAIRLQLLGYKKYDKQLKQYIGRRHYCKYCYGNRFYDIDYFDGVVDCRNCGYHIDSIEFLIGFLVDEGKIPEEAESELPRRR